MFLVPMTRHANDFSRHLDRLLDDGLLDRLVNPAAAEPATAARAPALDITETDRGYTVLVDMPGVAKEDVKVHIEGRRVSLSAESRLAADRPEGERVVHRERSASRYARSFTLPVEIDQASSEARLNDGVLTLSLAKRGAGAAAHLSVQ